MDEEIADIVRQHGWFAANVSDAHPPFLYSIGLMTTWNHPEFIVFGLESNVSHGLISRLIDEIRKGKSFAEAGVYPVNLGETEIQIGIRRVHPTQHSRCLGFAMGFARRSNLDEELEAMQVFWPDQNGKFPFDVGCAFRTFTLQPRIDVGLTPSEIREFERQWE